MIGRTRFRSFRDVVRRSAHMVLGVALCLPCFRPDASRAQEIPDWRPVELGDGWAISTPEDQGVDSRFVQQAIELAASSPDLDSLYSMIFIRHGTLIAEAYFHGRTRDDLNSVRSVTKSVTSFLVGIALDKGHLHSLDQTLFRLLPEYDDLLAGARRRTINLRDVLTMQTGLQWDDDTPGYYWSQWPYDLVRYVLEQPLVENPGTTFRYSTGNSQLLSAVLVRVTGQSVRAYARRHLFEPLGISEIDWWQHDDGLHYGGVGLQIRSRDMAKIGLLAAQGGVWETASGEALQVVPASWIEASTRDQVGYPVEGEWRYGYHWWIRDWGFGAFGSGEGRQMIAFVPEADLIIVCTARAENPSRVFDSDPVYDLLQRGVLPETPGRLELTTDRLEIGESEGWVNVEVARRGGSDGAAKVVVQTLNGSARAREDFQPTARVLSWTHGDARSKSLRIPILQDQEREGEETVRIELKKLTGGVVLGRASATLAITDDDCNACDEYLYSAEYPDFRFRVAITSAGEPILGRKESDCLPETLCVSGALPGRSELFVRIVGPRPNGFLHAIVVRFTTAEVEVEIEQLSTGQTRTYVLPALPRSSELLTGLVDRSAFLPSLTASEIDVAARSFFPWVTDAPTDLTPVSSRALPPGVTESQEPDPWITSAELPDFRFRVSVTSGDSELAGSKEAECLPETVCVSGALQGRSELFLRLIGPRPNGHLWLNLVRFTTSQVRVEIQQLSTGQTKTYTLEAIPRSSDALTGRVDRQAFLP